MSAPWTTIARVRHAVLYRGLATPSRHSVSSSYIGYRHRHRHRHRHCRRSPHSHRPCQIAANFAPLGYSNSFHFFCSNNVKLGSARLPILLLLSVSQIHSDLWFILTVNLVLSCSVFVIRIHTLLFKVHSQHTQFPNVKIFQTNVQTSKRPNVCRDD